MDATKAYVEVEKVVHSFLISLIRNSRGLELNAPPTFLLWKLLSALTEWDAKWDRGLTQILWERNTVPLVGIQLRFLGYASSRLVTIRNMIF